MATKQSDFLATVLQRLNSCSIIIAAKIYLHKSIFPLLKRLFRRIRKHDFVIVNGMKPTDTNAIFAVNHSSKYDIPYVCELIGKHSYVLIGQQPLEAIDRIAFYLNGAVWVDRKNRFDKNRAKEKMIALLNCNANIVMFPEGTWNLTPSKPMLPLYWGIIDIAGKTQKPIIPVILEYTGKKCYVSFGEQMHINPSDDKRKRIEDLADSLASLKWQIWENYSDTGCDSVDDWNEEVAKRIAEYPKLDYEYEQSVVRKEIYAFEEIIDLRKITPALENAFLFNKRNHD